MYTYTGVGYLGIRLCSSIHISISVKLGVSVYMRVCEGERKNKEGNTDAAYIDLLPLRHVSDEPGEAEEADQGEELGQTEDA